MSEKERKVNGCLFSGLWLVFIGLIGWLFAFLTLLAQKYPETPWRKYFSWPPGQLLLNMGSMASIPIYLVLGVGPVLGFVILMKRFRMALEREHLVGLAVCVIITLVLLIIYRPG